MVGPKAIPFWDKADKTETCWLWRAARFSNGYGMHSVSAIITKRNWR